MKRYVHLDLKGAPNLVEYLIQCIALFKKAGADGILFEYEDTFPFSGDLDCLRNNRFCYSENDILSLLNACAQLQLDVIPLVQTLGHFEYVLKHSCYANLREHPKYVNSLCVCHPQSMELVCSILDQVLELHSNIQCFHIGADEVWQLCTCVNCHARLTEHHVTPTYLFLEHIANVAAHLKSRRPGLRVLFWDDMLRSATDLEVESIAKRFDFDALLEPVIWFYGTENLPGVLPTYSRIFSTMWVASAFKGASGAAQTIPNVSLHVDNQKLWLSTLGEHCSRGGGGGATTTQFGGVFLTGWSRYDHYAVLCELLPSCIPSLLLCLSIWKHRAFTESAHIEASQLGGLPANQLMKVSSMQAPKEIEDCWDFPGCQVYAVCHWQANLVATFRNLMQSELFEAWFKKSNVRRLHLSAIHIDRIAFEVKQLLQQFRALEAEARERFIGVYDASVCNEWLEQHILPYKNKCERILWATFQHFESRARDEDEYNSAEAAAAVASPMSCSSGGSGSCSTMQQQSILGNDGGDVEEVAYY